MRKQWIAFAVTVIGVSMSALGIAAQGPQGAGAGGGETKQSSKAPHSYNPVKLIKKDSNKEAKKPQEAKAAKSSAKQATNDDPTPRVRRSYNPIKWIKKDSNQGAKKPKQAKATKSSAKQAMNDDPTPRTRRSYNPIHWFKKDRNKATEKPKKANDKKPARKSTTSEAPARPADA